MEILRDRVFKGREPRRRSFELSSAEQTHVKTALKSLHKQLGGWRSLAARLGCSEDTLQKAAGDGRCKASRPSVGLAVRVAQAAEITVEDLLSGAWFKRQPCPVCGRCEG